MYRKEYIDIKNIIVTDEYIDMIDIEVNTPDNTFLLENNILTHNSNVGVVNQLAVNALITSKRGMFIKKDLEKDEKAGILSVNSVMVPFIGSTDGCRVMFSGSQGRQTIPIKGAEQPIVQTGYESILPHLLSEHYVKKAKDNGKIIDVNNQFITIQYKNGKKELISLDFEILRSGQGQNSISEFRPLVKKGDVIRKNQIIAEGSHLRNGVISQGCNLLCALMLWKGYSFEDGYIISESVANDKFVSKSYHEDMVLVTSDDEVKFLIEEGTDTKVGEPLLIRSSKSIEKLMNIEELDEVEGGQIIKKSPGGKVIKIEIYPNISIKRFPILYKQYEKFKKEYIQKYGTFPDKFKMKISNTSDKEYFNGILIKFKLIQEEVCVLGDKITNSYGGKGVLALIEKDKNMPVTPWGESIEVILNPLAVINRMNPSTVKEMYVSLASKFLARKIVDMDLKNINMSKKLMLQAFKLLDPSKEQEYFNRLKSSLDKLSKEKFKLILEQIKQNNYILPFIIPPFKELSLSNIENLLKLVGAKTSYYLKLPEFNTKTKYPIAVGYLYYRKLEQQSGIKMSARSSGGLINLKTGQPLAGKKVRGGQRLGEMDSWSLIDHGAINILKELFGPLSDDMRTKNQIINEIIQNGKAGYKEPEISPTSDLLAAYMKGLMLETPLEIKSNNKGEEE